jgi:CRISPR-associated protein Cas5d
MEYTDREYCIEVRGEMACFTRPELKVERVSYDVITPSAARAIFEAILFKKGAMRWEITKIEVLNPIKWISIRRNEVGAIASTTSPKPLLIEDKRQQRNSLMLRDVAYRLYAKLIFIPLVKRNPNDQSRQPGNDENPMKYYEMFERRVSKGQCFTQPYLGTRECAASWRWVQYFETEPQPIEKSSDFGIMLYDMDFSDPKNILAMFYRVRMDKGVIIVPPFNSEEIYR